MDKQQQPGISINGVYLYDTRIGDINPEAELSYNLGITALVREVATDEKLLIYMVSFDVMHGIETPPFKFTFTYTINYQRNENSNMEWDEFTHVHALTHALPYIREFITNMTTRMGVPVLSLPPTNVYMLLEEYQKQTQE